MNAPTMAQLTRFILKRSAFSNSGSLRMTCRYCGFAFFVMVLQWLHHSPAQRSAAFERSLKTAPTSPWASLRTSLSVSKSDLHDLHFHPVVPDPCKKPEKAADGRVSQIVVTQHIAPAGHLQTAVPWESSLFASETAKYAPTSLIFAVLSHVLAIIFTAVRLAASKTSTPPGKASAIPCTSALTCWVRK